MLSHRGVSLAKQLSHVDKSPRQSYYPINPLMMRLMKDDSGNSSVLAVDIGGTKIASAIVSHGRIIARGYNLTHASEGPDAIISRLHGAIEKLLQKTDERPGAIAIACAGAIDTIKGIVTTSPNLPQWYNVPLLQLVSEKFKLKTLLINDASAAALAEHRDGAARGYKNCVYITVSTGIGSGIIIENQLYLGACGAAGEIGHTTIDINGPPCYCGNYGCLEVLASGSAIARNPIARLKKGEDSPMLTFFAGRLEEITAKDVHLAAVRGDKLANEVIQQAAGYLGVGMVNTVNTFNPDLIVIGGGVSKMGRLILGPVEKVVARQAFPLSTKAVKIILAALGDDSGLVGAAIYAAARKDT